MAAVARPNEAPAEWPASKARDSSDSTRSRRELKSLRPKRCIIKTPVTNEERNRPSLRDGARVRRRGSAARFSSITDVRKRTRGATVCAEINSLVMRRVKRAKIEKQRRGRTRAHQPIKAYAN